MKNILRKSLIPLLSAVAIFALAPTNLLADKPDSPPGKPAVTPPESPPGNPDVTAPGLESLYIKLVTEIDLEADGTTDGIFATYNHDGNGNLIKITFDQNMDDVIDRIENYTYYDDGKPMTWSYDSGANGSIDGTWKWFYDEEGNKKIQYIFSSGVLTDIYTYTYDNGKLLTINIYKGQDNYDSNTPYVVISNIYDENGLKTREDLDYTDNNIFDTIITNTYDNKGNRILRSLDGGGSDPDGTPDRLMMFTYDNKGNLLSDTQDLGANGLDSKDKITIYTYDNKGNRLTESFDNDANGVVDYILYHEWIKFN